jgi:hypothetical protein
LRYFSVALFLDAMRDRRDSINPGDGAESEVMTGIWRAQTSFPI